MARLVQCLLGLHLLHSTTGCLVRFRYHPTDASTAKREEEERLEAEYDDEDLEDLTVAPERDVVVVETPEGGRLVNYTKCGRKGGTRSSLAGHVVGGDVARENELPWHVSMLRNSEGWHGCSATLLSCDPPIVLTAAHCVEKTRPEDLKLGFGSYQLAAGRPSPLGSSEQRLKVSEIILHPQYSSYVIRFGKCIGKECGKERFLFNALNISIFENDIAILKLESPDLLQCQQRKIWPACLPNRNFGYGGWERTILSGWGRTSEGGNWSRYLKRARIPIVSDSECTRNLFNFRNSVADLPWFPFKINRKQLCAGKTTPNKRGGCQGDSGGPLVAQDEANNGWSLVGIVSWGLSSTVEGGGCGNDRYTVFTEVGKYLPWIASTFDLEPPKDYQF